MQFNRRNSIYTFTFDADRMIMLQFRFFYNKLDLLKCAGLAGKNATVVVASHPSGNIAQHGIDDLFCFLFRTQYYSEYHVLTSASTCNIFLQKRVEFPFKDFLSLERSSRDFYSNPPRHIQFSSSVF